MIGDAGEEFGVTTGRRRKVNWLNMNKLVKAINISGTTNVIISKVDILETIEMYRFIYNDEVVSFKSLESMKWSITDILNEECFLIEDVIYSTSPQNI